MYQTAVNGNFPGINYVCKRFWDKEILDKYVRSNATVGSVRNYLCKKDRQIIFRTNCLSNYNGTVPTAGIVKLLKFGTFIGMESRGG